MGHENRPKFEMHVNPDGRVEFLLLDKLNQDQFEALGRTIDNASLVTVTTRPQAVPPIPPCEVIVLKCGITGETS